MRTTQTKIHSLYPLGGPTWQLGPPNSVGIRPILLVMEVKSKTEHKLPRYVQTRKLKSGKTAYYWCPPHWARKYNFPLKSKALGLHLDKAKNEIESFNSRLDKWRIERKARE